MAPCFLAWRFLLATECWFGALRVSKSPERDIMVALGKELRFVNTVQNAGLCRESYNKCSAAKRLLMQNQPKKPEPGTTESKEISLPLSDEVVLRHEEVPPKVPEDKRIHRRRPLPLVPEEARKEK
jgi:hypothetical protein